MYDRINDLYAADEQYHPLVQYFTQPESKVELSPRLQSKLHRFSYHNGLLHYQVEANDEPRIVAPNDEDIRHSIVYECHDTPNSGHLGREKTYLNVSRNFWWPKLYKFVAKYVRTCEVCQRVKPSPSSEAPLQSLPVASDHWKSVSMDFIFGLPADNKGRSGILVFVDRVSKMVHLAAVHESVTAVDSATIFFNEVFRHHGMPETLISDRDPRFTSTFWRSLFALLGSRLHMSTADHPETDGQTERVNRVIEDILRSFCSTNPRTWSSLLPSVEFSINNSVHASTGFSPFYLNSLRHPRLPHTLTNRSSSRFGVGGTSHVDSSNSGHVPRAIAAQVKAFTDKRLSTLRYVRDSIADALDKQKQQSDKHGRKMLFVFNVGDKVLLSTKNLPKEAISNLGSTKLLPRFIGPFEIVKKMSDRSYKLDLPTRMRIHPTFYVGRLKPYQTATPQELNAPQQVSAREQRLKEIDSSLSLIPPSDRSIVSIHNTNYSGRTPPPPIVDSAGNIRYVVERILQRRRHNSREQHLVRWLGYSSHHDSWEDRDTLLEDVPDLVTSFDATN